MQQKTLGGNAKAPLHLVSAEGAPVVVMEAYFGVPTNPLFFLELRNEENFFLYGQWWIGGPKYEETSSLCTTVPIRTQDCHKSIEKNGDGTFTAQTYCEFLK